MGNSDLPEFHVVYFAYVYTGSNNWMGTRSQKLIFEQLKELNDFGITAAAKSINIVFNYPIKGDKLIEIHAHNNYDVNDSKIVNNDEVENSIKKIIPSAKINTHFGNQHEYQGIHRVWTIGKEIPDPSDKNTFILYFHAKGISNSAKSQNIKNPTNRKLTNRVIKPWREILTYFTGNEKINKAAYSCSIEGSGWYNFWWVRANYLKNSPEPILTKDRYYYESWLGKRKNENQEEVVTTEYDCAALSSGVKNVIITKVTSEGANLAINANTYEGGGERRKTRKHKKLKKKNILN